MSKVSKKKGLSMEEKGEKVHHWFTTHPHPYTLKELTSLIPKATGVIWQSIEECVELLVSEGKIRQDKVGVHTLFWCFPATATQTQHAPAGGGVSTSGGDANGDAIRHARLPLAVRLASLTLEELREQKASQEAALHGLAEQLVAHVAEVGSEEAVIADAKKLQAYQQSRVHLLAQQQRLAAFNPQLLRSLRTAAREAFDAANRWTDNYFLLEQHMTARMGRSSRELRAMLHVPEDLDFVEWEELHQSHHAGAIQPTPPHQRIDSPEKKTTATAAATPCPEPVSHGARAPAETGGGAAPLNVPADATSIEPPLKRGHGAKAQSARRSATVGTGAAEKSDSTAAAGDVDGSAATTGEAPAADVDDLVAHGTKRRRAAAGGARLAKQVKTKAAM